MQEIVTSVKNTFSTYGFKAAIIVILTVIIVNLIKKPILKKVGQAVIKQGYDKAIVTKNFTYIVFVVAFVLDFIVEIVMAKFNFYNVNVMEILSQSAIYGGLSIGLYETVKIHLEAYVIKKTE